ncbi:hypothetical protein P0Y43_24025 [Pseudomonas entomophila]|uniref:hypothetical protein n=1 Tax=Pseudomonas entomophila TaxID=312306 RepID=UPI0023D8B2E5|nr:hypothetical protein [Pseudomonas entomophila]MDF0733750.1 hypothetical protein [Pseudomonas entomophila]
MSRIVSNLPIGKYSAVYEVLSNSGGATVPMTYLYFIAPRQDDEQKALDMLKGLSPFLVTRQPGAIERVQGLKVHARTHDTVYRYSSTAVLREDGEVSPVSVELTATLDDLQ